MPDLKNIAICHLRDLEDAYELWVNSDTRVDDPQSPREAGWRRYFDQYPERFLSAYTMDGNLVGVCAVFFDGRKAGVYRLAVAKEWRRCGIARELLKQAEIDASAAGLHGIYALVDRSAKESRSLFANEDYSEMESVRYFTKSL